MRKSLSVTTFIILLLMSYPGFAASLRVKVTEAYISIYSGPGVGYPVFLDLERGSWLVVQGKQVDWYEVITDKGDRGWVKYTELAKTVTADGQAVDLANVTRDDFENRSWELGALWGEVKGATLFTLYGGFAFNSNLSTELSVSEMIGSLSTSHIYTLSVIAHPFPEWRVSPYFLLGTGIIKTKTNATLVQERDKEDKTTSVGFGVRAYLTRSFFLRAEYSELLIYTSTNDYEELELWSIGVGSFF